MGAGPLWPAPTLATFGDVEVEEIAVEDRLDQAGHDGNEVKEALEVVAPDPVEEIERAVHAQCEQVVAGDGLRLARLAHHEELRQDGHRLQVDGEGPEDLQGGGRAGAEGRTRWEGPGRERRQVAVTGTLEKSRNSEEYQRHFCVPDSALPAPHALI